MAAKTPRFRCSLVGIACITFLGSASLATAQDGDAPRILKAMSDYLASQKRISATVDTDIEIITPDLQKIQFSSSGRFDLQRPDKLRVSRSGGYSDVELVFDGKTATILGKHINAFAQIDSPGSTDKLIDRLRSEYSIEAPGADLLLTGAYDELIKGVRDAKYIGRGVIGGIECEHLAFRDDDTDWQIWIEVGSNPIPRKYVITSKAVTGAPQYTLLVRDFKVNASPGPDDFAFKEPPGAKKVDVKDLSEIDEVPAGVVKGSAQ